jgi:hypothetical protein
MKKASVIFLLTAIAILGLSVTPNSNIELTQAHATIDATSAWNSVCQGYGFPQAPVGDNGTFADHWSGPPWSNGSTAQTSLDACCRQVARILGTPEPGFGDGDIFDVSIQNWPD